MNKIVDADGYNRFIDLSNQISIRDSFVKSEGRYIGVTLSGSHLMIVIAGEIPQQVFPSAVRLWELALPTWLHNKIYNTAGSGYVAYEKAIVFKADGTSREIDAPVWKDVNYIYCTPTQSEDYTNGPWYIRFQVDLVIN